MERLKRVGLLALLFAALQIPILAYFARASEGAEKSPVAAKIVIARMWSGRTKTLRADEYYKYLVEAGIKKIQKIEGNLGVQVLRRVENEETQFTVISYWESVEAIKRFAGDDIEKTHHLPRDPEFLLELPPTVKHYSVLFNDMTKTDGMVRNQ